ncbi:exo-beta-N-acetylmuramidase NamZ family protein [Phaeocystidibacter luteus]|nr:DUF1343 domain-containing protein [Phaeocystidibacter luteus]
MNTIFEAKDRQMPFLTLILFTWILGITGWAQSPTPAADIPDLWLPKLEGKTIAVVANNTSRVGETHLVDFLVANNVTIKRVFSPEHGFRGKAAAGEHVSSEIDEKTGIPLVSLYGNHKKPAPSEVADVDLVLFDIQDVGVRFYTYISTMTYVMEACAENGIPFYILDRPNPHGNLIDGPILEPEFTSFVGLHPVPIAHGMTVGEYAAMVKGEGWIKDSKKLDLSVFVCNNYTHESVYELPVAPSPNLPNQASIMLYPSLCLFEGTVVSIGRGTDLPFQQFGAPWFEDLGTTFTPTSRSEAPHPKYENEECYGVELASFGENFMHNYEKLYIFWLLEAHRQYNGDEPFFTNYFRLLAGTEKLQKQIEHGWSEAQIRESWEEGLSEFKLVREKYLLYE